MLGESGMNPYTACATAVVVLLTLLPLSRSKVWWVRVLDFPRLQLFALTAALLAVDLIVAFDGGWLGWLVPVAAAGCLVYHAWWITPYTWLFPLEVKPAPAAGGGDMLRVLVSNVRMSNGNSQALLHLVAKHRPHVLVTLESDARWQEHLDDLKAEYSFSIRCPLDNRYGMHVYARLPLEDSRVESLVQDGVPSMHTRIRMASGQLVQAHFVHPAPPSPTENDASTERDVELLTVASRVAGVAAPVIVTGDLNDVAWSRTTRQFRKVSHLLDPRVGRGMFNTFHAGHWFGHSAWTSLWTLSRIPTAPRGGCTRSVCPPARTTRSWHQHGWCAAEGHDRGRAKSLAR